MQPYDLCDEPLFQHQAAGLGTFSLYLLNPRDDSALLHRWLSAERAHFWGMQHLSQLDLMRYYQAMQTSGQAQAYLGYCQSSPAFLLESYDPAQDVLAQHYPVAPGDRGMHFFTAPATQAQHGFTRAVMQTILSFLFSQARTERIVVEPDVHNHKIHPINREAGFIYQQQITLPHKQAWLAFCHRQPTRQQEYTLC